MVVAGGEGGWGEAEESNGVKYIVTEGDKPVVVSTQCNRQMMYHRAVHLNFT